MSKTVGKSGVIYDNKGVCVYAIPHQMTQNIFDSELQDAVDFISRVRPRTSTTILLLHCNYNSPFANDDASLNLTVEDAETLLEVFDKVLIGHEHIPRSDFDGRLQILGNIHPTSFSDISDKYMWRFEDGRLHQELIWSKDTGYRKLGWEELLSLEIDWTGRQFIEITGTCPAARLPEVHKAVQKLWSQAPDALMIRNNVKAEALEIAQVDTQQKALDVPGKISAELNGTPLGDLWQHYLSEVA